MALDHTLYLVTPLGPAEALRLMAEHLKLKWSDEYHLSGPEVWIYSSEASEPELSLMSESFHFRPDLLVGFEVYTGDEGYEESLRIMLRATMLLLEHAGNAVLLLNGEHILLQRISGELVLNADYGNWTKGLMLEDEIRAPHDRRPLPSPLR